MGQQGVVSLDKEQQECVDSRDGVYVVLAGPGSGKTRVLVQRYISMLVSGIPTSDMVNLTFTNAAAVEMVQRVGLLDAENVFRTFHSFALDLLKKERAHLPYSLCDTIIPVQMEDYQLLFDLVKIYPTINWRTLHEKITAWKCQDIMPDKAIEQCRAARGTEYFYGLAYRDYEKKCREQGWLDFDSLMREVVNLLETNEEVRARWKRKYISVDEAQDCDVIQFRLLQLIFDGNIFVVGDENQLIFEWRNAQAGNLSHFARAFPGARTLYLGRNYRSTASLVQFFKEILPVDNGLASHMTTNNIAGVPFTVTKYADAEQEASHVLEEIKEDPINSAIIARTNRQLFVFQRLCTMRGTKYKILGKKDFWEQNEVKKLLTLAKNTSDGRPASTVLSDLIRSHNLLEIYKHSGSPMESSPIENLNSVVKMAAGKGSIHEFLDYLRRLTHARKSAKGVTLTTVHQAKGREWDHVYVVGVTQGILPHKESDNEKEEARIFFVACSRAAEDLHVSFYDQPSMYLNNYHDRIVEFQGERNGDTLR